MLKSISDTKQEFLSLKTADIPNFIFSIKNDNRKGVLNILKNAEKKYNEYLAEIERIKTISFYENECYDKGFNFVAGVDEVGRGPLAGPVVTAAVILKKGAFIQDINDSKKLSYLKREKLYDIITNEAVSYCFGIVSPKEIDDINILQATYKAMKQSLENLSVKPDFVLADAVTIPNIHIKQNGIIKGDSKSISIGAASIIAKVYRDRIMEKYAEIYPEYGFDRNKGYGSKEHIEAIKKYGICPIHRRSFVKNIIDYEQ